MSIADVFRVNTIKAERDTARKECGELKAILAESGRLDLFEIKKAISRLEDDKKQRVCEINNLEAGYQKTKDLLVEQIAELDKQLAAKRNELVVLDEEILLQSFGFYKLQYDLRTSDSYRIKLYKVREQQAEMVKSGKAASCPSTWTLNNSQKEGERMIKDYTKLIVRSFNNECDASIVNVKFNNVESIGKRINKAYETLNKLAQRMHIAVANEFGA